MGTRRGAYTPVIEAATREATTSWGTLMGTSATLLNGTLGPAMLVLPLAFSRTGLVPGAVFLGLTWIMSYMALLLLLETCSHLQCSSLVELCRRHGPRMSVTADVSVVLYFYGSCISYLILIGGTFAHVIHLSLPRAPLALRQAGWWAEGEAFLRLHGGSCLLALFTLGVMLPLSKQPLSSLSGTPRRAAVKS